MKCINITFDTELWVSYVPRLAKVVNVLAVRQVKQGTEYHEIFCLQRLSFNSLYKFD